MGDHRVYININNYNSYRVWYNGGDEDSKLLRKDVKIYIDDFIDIKITPLERARYDILRNMNM